MMDEAYVVVVAAEHEDRLGTVFLGSFPFATRRGAEAAATWFALQAGVAANVIEDRELDEEEADLGEAAEVEASTRAQASKGE